MSDGLTVPVVDLGAAAPGDERRPPEDLAAEVDAACRDVGFLGVVGHGVDPCVVDGALAVARAFFTLPAPVKARHRLEVAPLQRGWQPPGAEAQSGATGERTPPDLSETFATGPVPLTDAADPYRAENPWPDDVVPGFRSAWDAHRRATMDLARHLLRACAVVLHGDATALDATVEHPIGTLRANWYPEVHEAPADGQRRGGAHTDYGTLTVLAVDGVPGLEIRDADGAWHRVEPVPGGFVVNVGDLLSAWSDGRWRSTWHRVSVPAGPLPHPARLSLATFQFPDPTTPTGLTGGASTAGEHLLRQLGAIRA